MTRPWDSAQPVDEARAGDLVDDTELRARALAVGLCAALADWASATGEDVLVREYLRGIDRAVV